MRKRIAPATPPVGSYRNIPYFALRGVFRQRGYRDQEVAEALGCSLPTARNIMLRADFPLIRVGKNLKVELNAFLNWSQKRRV